MKKPGPRRADGFIRAGEADLSRTGLSLRRAKELRLHRAWTRIAGRKLAGRLRPVRVVRGCLELEFLDSEWSAALQELLPDLVARLAMSDTGLGIRKYLLLGENAAPVSVKVMDRASLPDDPG